MRAGSAGTGQGAWFAHATAWPPLCWVMHEPGTHGTRAGACPALYPPALGMGLGAGGAFWVQLGMALGQAGSRSKWAVLKDATGKDAAGKDAGEQQRTACGTGLG